MIKPHHIPQNVWDDMSIHCEERDGPIVKDGQRISRPMTLIDSARPMSFFDANDGGASSKPELAHRPQSFPMSAQDAADIAALYAARDAANAWRDPPPLTTNDTTAFDASMSLDALRAEAEARLTNAWRNP